MSTGTDVRLMFEENRNVIVQPNPDLADHGAPQIQGVAKISDIDADAKSELAARANGVSASINDPSNKPNIPVANTGAVSDMGLVCNTIGNGLGELFGSTLKTVGMEEDPALKVATPQVAQRPTFGFA